MNRVKQMIRLNWGLLICGVGMYLEMHAGIGYSPWDAFSAGIGLRTGMLFGDVVFFVSLAVIAVDLLLKEKIGVGTLLNGLIVGKYVDLLNWLDLLPKPSGYITGVPVMLLGQLVVCIAAYYYIGAGLGCGPRDCLFVHLGKRFPRLPIGLARLSVECVVLSFGWMMGAPVGLGTVMFMVTQSSLMQLVFDLHHFDAKAVQHESVPETVRAWMKKA